MLRLLLRALLPSLRSALRTRTDLAKGRHDAAEPTSDEKIDAVIDQIRKRNQHGHIPAAIPRGVRS